MPDTDGGGPRPTAAVLLAAGEGKRMRSALPKVMHPIGGVTLLGHAAAAVAALLPEHLAVVVGHGREQVSAEVEALGKQLGRPLVTSRSRSSSSAPATRCAAASRRCRRGLAGAVVVTYADVPLLDAGTLRTLLAEHAAAGAAVTLLTAEFADPTGYGRVLRGPDGAVTGIVEQADATPEQRAIREVNSGVYAFDAAFLAAGLADLSGHNAQGELYLTDLVAAAVARGLPVRSVGCPDLWQVQGVNDRVQLAAAARRAEPAGAGALDARRGDGDGPRDDVGGRRGAPGPGRRAATRAPSCTDPRSSTTARRSGRTPP